MTDAVKRVTCEKPEVFNEKGETHIVLMHYGCKRNIVRLSLIHIYVGTLPFCSAASVRLSLFDRYYNNPCAEGDFSPSIPTKACLLYTARCV